MSNYTKLLGQLPLPEEVNLEVKNKEAKTCLNCRMIGKLNKKKNKQKKND